MTFLETMLGGEFWAIRWWGNSLPRWVLVTLGVLALFRLGLYARRHIARRIRPLTRRLPGALDEVVVDFVEHTHVAVVFVAAAYVGTLFLSLSRPARGTAWSIIVAAIVFQCALWAQSLVVRGLTTRFSKGREENGSRSAALALLLFTARLLVWVVAALLILENLGVDVTTLVAGLGIGGVAVALAVQNILGDILASLSIVLDKPFEVGDFIIVGGFMGTVERVGIKTTRIRALSGELLIITNSDLLKSRIKNFKTLAERRVVFTFGLRYDTPLEKLREVPTMIREAITRHERVRFDRAHCKEFGLHAVTFEAVYFVLGNDYNESMDIGQQINFELLERFGASDIQFGTPGADRGVS